MFIWVIKLECKTDQRIDLDIKLKLQKSQVTNGQIKPCLDKACLSKYADCKPKLFCTHEQSG